MEQKTLLNEIHFLKERNLITERDLLLKYEALALDITKYIGRLNARREEMAIRTAIGISTHVAHVWAKEWLLSEENLHIVQDEIKALVMIQSNTYC